MDDLTLANMRTRVQRCRWLALNCTDPNTSAVLRKTADDGQADIDRMIADGSAEER